MPRRSSNETHDGNPKQKRQTAAPLYTIVRCWLSHASRHRSAVLRIPRPAVKFEKFRLLSLELSNGYACGQAATGKEMLYICVLCEQIDGAPIVLLLPLSAISTCAVSSDKYNAHGDSHTSSEPLKSPFLTQGLRRRSVVDRWAGNIPQLGIIKMQVAILNNRQAAVGA